MSADEEFLARQIEWYNTHQQMTSIHGVFDWKKIELRMRDAGVRTGRHVVCAHCGAVVASDHLESCQSVQTGIIVLKRAC